jgi:hypothetical protein
MVEGPLPECTADDRAGKASRQAGLECLRRTGTAGGHLKQLQDPIPFAKDAMLSAVGLIPTTVISLIAWIPNYAQLPANAQADYWWVTPVMLAVAIAAVVIATVMWLTRGAINARVKRDADLLYDDMDHVHHFSDG